MLFKPSNSALRSSTKAPQGPCNRLLVVAEVEEGASEEEKGGSLSSFQAKQLSFQLFNIENSAKEFGEEEIQVIKIKIYTCIALEYTKN